MYEGLTFILGGNNGYVLIVLNCDVLLWPGRYFSLLDIKEKRKKNLAFHIKKHHHSTPIATKAEDTRYSVQCTNTLSTVQTRRFPTNSRL